MIQIAYIVLAMFIAWIFWQYGKKVMAQRRHLNEWDMKNLMNGKIHKFPDDHERVVAHLSGCLKCQKDLEVFNSGKKIEK